MALPAFECPVGGCDVEIPATSEAMQMMYMQTHMRDMHGAMQAPLEQRGTGETGTKAQKLVRPVIRRTALRSSGPFSSTSGRTIRGSTNYLAGRRYIPTFAAVAVTSYNTSCTLPPGVLLRLWWRRSY